VSIAMGTPGSGGTGNGSKSDDNVKWGADGGAEMIVKIPVWGEKAPQ
jgi:hypothetical protein